MPDDVSRGHQQGQVGRDRPGPAAHVEQALARAQLGQQIGAGVLGRAPGVAAQHGFVVPVRVGHAYIVSCPNCPRCRRCPSASTRCWPARPCGGPTCSVSPRSRPTTPRPTRSQGHRLVSVGRRAKYLVWEFDDGDPHRAPPLPGRPPRRGGAAEEDEAPRRGGPLRLRRGRRRARRRGHRHPGARVRHPAQGVVVGARARRRGPAGRPRPRAGERGVRRLHPHQRLQPPPDHRPARPARGLGHRARLGRRHLAAGQAVALRLAALPHSRAARGALAAATDVLAEALELERTRPGGLSESSLGGRFKVHGRFGEPCPTCGTTLQRVSFESYEMAYCPTCQTGGKVLADRRLSRLLK